jgi:hypothetical protein
MDNQQENQTQAPQTGFNPEPTPTPQPSETPSQPTDYNSQPTPAPQQQTEPEHKPQPVFQQPQPLQPTSSVPSTQPEHQYGQISQKPNETKPNDDGKSLAIAGLILGLVALSPIGLILSIISKSKAKKASAKTELATAGIVLNIIVLIGSIAAGSFFGYTAYKITGYNTNVKNNTEIVRVYADAFYEDRNEFPSELKNFDEGTVDGKIVNELVQFVDELNNENGQTSIIYQYTEKNGIATGAKIIYFDYKSNEVSDEIIYLGDADKDSTFIDIL